MTAAGSWRNVNSGGKTGSCTHISPIHIWILVSAPPPSPPPPPHSTLYRDQWRWFWGLVPIRGGRGLTIFGFVYGVYVHTVLYSPMYCTVVYTLYSTVIGGHNFCSSVVIHRGQPFIISLIRNCWKFVSFIAMYRYQNYLSEALYTVQYLSVPDCAFKNIR